MNSFRDWYVRNQDAITWFIIGVLTSGMIEQLIKQNYILAAISAGLIYVNYKFSKIRLH